MSEVELRHTRPSSEARSPKVVQRAIEEYGTNPTDPRIMMYAKLLAEGRRQREAYLLCYPEAAEWTQNSRDSQASILAAHPKVAEWISAHALGSVNLARAATPQALARTVELSQGQHGANAKVQLDAASSLLDRGGVPRSKEFAVSAQMISLELLAEIEATPDAEQPLLEVDAIDALDDARTAWAEIASPPEVD